MVSIHLSVVVFAAVLADLFLLLLLLLFMDDVVVAAATAALDTKKIKDGEDETAEWLTGHPARKEGRQTTGRHLSYHLAR